MKLRLLAFLFILIPCIAWASPLPELYTDDFDYISFNADLLDFREDYDLFDFNEKSGSSSTFDQGQQRSLSLTGRFSDYLYLQVGTRGTTIDASRVSEPYTIQEEYREKWAFLQWQPGSFGLRLSLSQGHSGKLDFIQYQFRQVLFGEDIVLLNPVSGEVLPAVSLEMRSKSYGLDLFNVWAMGKALVQLSAGYMYSDIDPQVDSVLFRVMDETFLNSTVNDQTVGSWIEQFKGNLPQIYNWQEHTFNISLDYKYRWNNTWEAEGRLTGYYVRRINYQERQRAEKQNYNIRLDLRLAYRPMSHLEIYLHGQAMNHFLLGMESGLYNRRTSHRFDNPIGYLGCGIIVSF